MTLDAGTKLGRYEILSLLGSGGMGEVYLAEDSELERKVALKLLPADFVNDTERIRRFIQEAKATSALNHPNILTIYEIGSFDNIRFIASEYVKGETLRDRLERGRLELNETLEIAVQIASALQAAHSAKIVHRDIKPENIMLKDDGLVKVLDFGLAKLTEQKPPSQNSEAPTLAQVRTQSGIILGTVAYMSPEQARGKAVDERTDIWSLGVCLYEMLTGKQPFTSETMSDSIASILTKKVESPTDYNKDIPTELELIVLKTLVKDREERYQTAKDLLIDLRRLKKRLEFESEFEPRNSASKQPPESGENKPTQLIKAPPTSGVFVTKIKRHPIGVLVGLAVLLTITTIGLIAYWFYGNRSASATNIESIAVLPFVNQSGNADNEYLSDGMTETLISSLSQLPNLSVKARSSVFRYKGKEIDTKKIGQELSVQAVLTGKVVQRGNDLSLFIELVDTNMEKVLWSENYSRSMTNLVTLQNEIARDVSQKLRARLSGTEKQKLTKNYTENTEAYQLYLMGRYHLNRLTDEGFRKGLDYFQKAIDKDPNYALAYAGLADAYARLSGYNAILPNEGFPKARAAASKALELDDQLAEAHVILGVVKYLYDWDWSGAEKEFKRAIEINPSNADVHQTYGYYLSGMQRFDEWIQTLVLHTG
ncbi:MAG: protein kinase [Acidobacteria bacterium]|nr:protein kinase [Acidobacteriota bacterium]